MVGDPEFSDALVPDDALAVAPEMIIEAQPPIPGSSLAAPHPEGLWASLIYAVCTLSLAYPALAGKFLAGPNSDQYVAGYAFREFAARTLRESGHFPLWNPYLFGGLPYVAAMHGDIFYPTFLLRMMLPTDIAMTWGFIIHLFLAGLFTFRFLRASGWGFYGSVFGGIAYMMSGQLASLVSPGHDGKLFVNALFPLALWMLLRGIRDGRTWAWGVLALAIGLAVLTPHPQVFQYLLLASAAYALFLGIPLLRNSDVSRRTIVLRLCAALIAVAIGMAMGAIQYLPVQEYVAWSPRAAGVAGYGAATSYAWPPKELLDVYLPQFSGMLEWYWGENAVRYHSDYIGVVVLMLAGAGFIGVRADPRRRQIAFWTVMLVVALLWSLGGHTPFYRIPYAVIPGTKFFRAPASFFFVGSFALAALSATGVERAIERRVSPSYGFAWLAFGLIIVGLAVTGELSTIAENFAADDLADAVVANSLNLAWGAWRSLGFVFVTTGVLLFLRRRKIPQVAGGWALILLVAADLWSILRHYWIFAAPASQLFASDPVVERIKRETQPARVIALQIAPTGVRSPNMDGDGLMVHGVRSVLGYHGNEIGAYDRLLNKNDGYREILNPNTWHMLNAKFVLTNIPDAASVFHGASWMIGPVKDATGLQTYLFRLPGENPYAWVAPAAVRAEDDAVLRTVLDRRFDVRSAALFAPDAQVPVDDSLHEMPAPLALPVTVTHYAPGKVGMELKSPAPAGSALVVSENFYPGWQARADGKSVPTGRVDYTLLGVGIPAGTRHVDLEFHSASYETGRVITVLALLFSLAAIMWGVVNERRRLA
jgi:hypothetical protein